MMNILKSSLVENVFAGLFLVAMVALASGMAWSGVTVVHDMYQQDRRDAIRRHELIDAQKRSPAHAYLVYHWFDCNGLNSTQASCFAGIQQAAKALHGEKFAQEVAVAAKDLSLID